MIASLLRAAALLLLTLTAVGCTAYAPKPLVPEDLFADWEKRKPDAKEVLAYARSRTKAGASGVYDPGDGIDFPEACILALFYNPELRLARMNARAVQAKADHAGRWEDPELDVDAMRVLNSVPKPWLSGAGLQFTIPLSGRNGVRKDQANAESMTERIRARQAEWALLQALQSDWLAWSVAREQMQLLDQALERTRALKKTADSLVSAGALAKSDARLIALERIRLGLELDAATAQGARLESKLKSQMGLLPYAPLTLVPGVPEASIPPELTRRTMRERLLQGNLELLALKQAYLASELALKLEIRKQYPDLRLGPRVGVEDGNTQIGFGFSLPIPLWNGNAQNIAEATVLRESARLRYWVAMERETGRLERILLARAAAQRRLQRLDDEVLPLVSEQETEIRRQATLGKFDPLRVLETIRAGTESRNGRIVAKQAVGEFGIQLWAILGPRPMFQDTGVKP